MSRLAVLFLCCACSSAPVAPSFPGNEIAGGLVADSVYRVHDGDQLEVRFPAFPKWNVHITVQPDGNANVPLVGSMLFRGSTLSELEAHLAKRLMGRVKSPRVELVLTSIHPRSVFVGGEVVEPGMLAIQGAQLSLLQAVFAKGGPKRSSASLSNVVLSRLDSDNMRHTWTVDLAARMEGLATPVLLVPGDVVLVPPSSVVEANRLIEQYITKMLPGGNILTGFVLAK